MGSNNDTMQNKIIILVGIIMLFNLFMGTMSADAFTSALPPQHAEITVGPIQPIPPMKLTNETESFQEAPFVIFADDHFYVAYQSNKTGNYDIFIRKYDSNWKFIIEEQITTNQSNQYSPSIEFADKNLYIAYYSDETGNSDIFVKICDLYLNPMGKKKQITKDESYQGFPSIAFVKDYLYIAYGSNETGDYDIFIEKHDLNLTPVGSGKKRITFEKYVKNEPSIIFTDNCSYIVYHAFEYGIDWDIAIKKYSLNLDGNEYCVNLDHMKSYIDHSSDDQAYPSTIFVDDILYVTYTSNENSKWAIFVKRYTPDLEAIGKPHKLINETFHPRSSSMTFLENNFYAVYSSLDEVGYPNVYMKKFDKNFFVERKANEPSMTFANNTFYVAYSSNEKGNHDIFIQKYASNLKPFGDPKQVTNETFDEDNPSIIFVNNSFYMAYDSNKKGNKDILVQKYDLDLNPAGRPMQITNKTFDENGPSIIFVNNSFYLGYHSIERENWDIFIRKYDLDWNPITELKQVTTDERNEAFPSITFGNNSLYIAYHLLIEAKNWDIVIEIYDLDLNESKGKKQLTTHRTYQARPSILFANNNLYVTYDSEYEYDEDYYYYYHDYYGYYGDNDIFLKRYDLNWRNVKKQITHAVCNDSNPSIIFMDDDLYMAYSSNEKGHYEINITKIEIPPFPLFKPIPKEIIIGVMMALIFFSVAIIYTKRDEIMINKRYKYLLLVFAGTIVVMFGYALYPPESSSYPPEFFSLGESDFISILFLLTFPYMFLVHVSSKNFREFFVLVLFTFLILFTGSLIYYWSNIPITETKIDEILYDGFVLSIPIIISLASRAAYPPLKKDTKEWIERRRPFVKIENPYRVGKPIRDKEMFFGRQDVFDSLKQRFKQEAAKTSIFLYGGRRIGKTSALYQIKGGALGDKFIPVLIDLQAIGDMDTYGFFGFITQELRKTLEGKGIKMKEYAFDSAKESYTATFTHVLDDVSNLIEDKQIILMFDETEIIEKMIRKGKFDSAIYSYCESIIQHKEKVSCIFTGSQGVFSKKKADTPPLFRAAYYQKITFLEEKYAVGLIKNPVEGFVWYNDKVIERILRITGHHPFYIQYICYEIVSILNKEKRKKVKMRDIDTVIEKLIKGAPMHLSYVWDTATYDEKIVLSLLSEIIVKENEFVSVSAIEKYKTEKEKKGETTIKLSARIDKILEDLHDEDILEKDSENRYRYKVDLIRYWVKGYHSVWRVIDEEEHESVSE